MTPEFAASDARSCHQAVNDNLKRMPWADTALPTLQYLCLSDHIKKAFKIVKSIESTTQSAKRAEYQFEHLMEVAWHEQKVVLQELIYKDPKFSDWIKRQRGDAHWASRPVKWFSPDLELIFTHVCSTDDPDLKSEAPA
ncbi:DUF2515 family protein [Chitinolyticbacter albus]|uniref:DUF2515 family protein n=1 Tax=Chitinolyticbacter albus TaxID=2961951 RepID=UPI00210E6DF1|nr:hypothetical protein [Chitinolyticbacter albus]